MTLLYEWLETSAKARGNNKALVYRDNYLSWRGLLHRVKRRSQEFKGMGLKEGAWVGLMLGNVPDFVILALALSKLGVTVVPIDPTTGARELELMLAAAPLRALVTRPRGSEATGGSTGTRRKEGEEAEEEEEEVAEIRRRLQGTLLTCSVYKTPNPDFEIDPLAIMFTADSLGDPKGVLRTKENFEASTDQVVDTLSIDTESRILCAVPLFHAYGWDVGLLPTLKTGATMFLEEEISARRVAKLLREHTIDVLPGTPTMYNELSQLPIRKKLSVENPRFLSGGSPLDTDVASSVEDTYGVKILSCYHSTETGVIAIDLDGKHPESVGKTIDGVELKIVGPRKNSKKGGLWIRGPALSPQSIGPYEDAIDDIVGTDETAIGGIDDDGWYRTGDVGKLDRASRLHLEGREDDLVKVEGKRVALGEVEGCLEQFPKVKEAEARLEADPLNGARRVVARVVATGKVKEQEIIDHCARNLAPYKVPRHIEFCDELA